MLRYDFSKPICYNAGLCFLVIHFITRKQLISSLLMCLLLRAWTFAFALHGAGQKLRVNPRVKV